MKRKKIVNCIACALSISLLASVPAQATELTEPSSVTENQEEIVESVQTENVEPVQEETTDVIEAEPDEGEMDQETKELQDIYIDLLKDIPVSIAAYSYETELAKFPASYQSFLTKLHEKHPNWIFVANDTGIDWNTFVKEESVSGKETETNQSFLEKTSGTLYLSKKSTDYNASTGKYIPKDGSTWVSASNIAVAYNVDPRNFLTDSYIFQFESLGYNKSYHTESGVEAVLKGTDLYKKKISYINTKGKTVSTDMTYAQVILAAGKNTGVSPLFLASRIRQETGAKLTNGSISGKFSSTYTGYYNFFNIGAYATASGSAVANGLAYAKKQGWTSPLLAIEGGAKFIANSYISKGQNTLYYEKFNVTYKPYFAHQYMQNLTAASSEASSTYKSYSSMGTVDNATVFNIPVYKSMPKRGGTVSVKKNVKTAKVLKKNVMRSGPSTSYGSVVTVPEGAKVKVLEVEHCSKTATIYVQELYPYWAKVEYGSKTGYIFVDYLAMNKDCSVKVGDSIQLNVSTEVSGENVYYMTSNPAIATVTSKGVVKGKKKGTCTIYVSNSAATKVDMVGITVGSTTSTSASSSAPKMDKLKNFNGYTTVCWKKVSGASGYYVYRKQSGGSWTKIAKITNGSTIKYKDKSVKSNTVYAYTVKYIKKSKKSSAAKSLKIRYLKTPVLVSAERTDDTILFKWKKVKGATSYQIYRKEEGGSFSKIAVVEGNANVLFEDDTITKGKTYYYTVYASDGTYRSYYSKDFKKVKI